MAPKRRAPPILPPVAKRRATDERDEDKDEDSLESILAQIKAQEESEALALRLQNEWNASASADASRRASSSRTVVRGGSSRHNNRVAPPDAIELSDDDFEEMQEPEDDEAMARRLAREWQLEDDAQVQLPVTPPPPASAAPEGKGKGKDDASCPDLLPPMAKLEEHRDVFTGDKLCPCGATLPSPRGQVVFSATTTPPRSLIRLLHAYCTSCKTNHCRGCMAPVPCSKTCKGTEENNGNRICPVPTCCTNVRAVALFEALGGFDKQYLAERDMSDRRAREAAAKAQKNKVGTVGPGGTGYGMDNRGWGVEYPARRGRSARGRGGGHTQPQMTTSGLGLMFDEIIVRALNTVTGFLPSPYADDPQIYDMLPHPSLDALIRLSQLPVLLADLLRNDSITDWIARIDVYHAMLSLLRRLADCELTLEVLVGPRWEICKPTDLESYLWQESDIVCARDPSGAPVRDPPLYTHFAKLTRQCTAFLAGATSMLAGDEGDEDGETAVIATSLCGDIVAARDDIERAMRIVGKDPAKVLAQLDEPSQDSEPSSPGGHDRGKGGREATTPANNGKGKGRDPAIDLTRAYARECERLAFRHCALSEPAPSGSGLAFPNYKYAAELAATANGTRAPRDRLHLAKELAVMATSLPPGVWVRVDEVRNDMIKVLIAGPDGTPYAGGLFEFDAHIPLQYPHKPPLLHLRTTGRGAVRFNPNLYDNGKVCLSLLGTWAGRPEEIPGYGKAVESSPASITYNKNIRLQTTRWAIVDWLQDEHKNGVWGEVIASHFLTRHDAIRQCIRGWAKSQPAFRNYNATSGRALHASPFMISHIYNGPGSAWTALPMSSSSAVPMSPWATGMPHVLPSHPRHARAQDGSTPQAKGMDLLEEFDKGIARVRVWTFEGTETDS
ncbi:uncharacterized protein BXZ73DRAFT_46887 [Epithele typhae]|uniref:uncharacterized protein n=1 Tax=Epithele typhae TaxID=378194 RepID=UPI0020078C08|nr:uncharacterized protein BXZ73DRAFT_46887 [Epithele typhae]KAH9932071.1 hypothetical protein BXZ73DRAFT_46887 [Epithele typhae]